MIISRSANNTSIVIDSVMTDRAGLGSSRKTHDVTSFNQSVLFERGTSDSLTVSLAVRKR